MQVTVVAVIKAKTGCNDALRAELLKLVGPTMQEEGCINYDLHESQEEPGHFLFYENWKSKEALDRHLKMPYIGEMLRKAEPLLAEPVDIQLFRRIG